MRKRRTERSVFEDLVEGFQSLQDEREGKITLRRFKVPVPQQTTLAPDEIRKIRDKLKLSRAVFARLLCTNVRTLEGWEQGRTRPNAQAVALMKLVNSRPETIQYLQEAA